MANMTEDAQSLAEQRGTPVHAMEALMRNLWEQKIKQAMATYGLVIHRSRSSGGGKLTDL